MLFNTFSFLIFFPVVLLIYFVIPKKIRYMWLLIASYYFYMSWSPKYGLLLLFSTLITYLGGLALSRIQDRGSRLTVLVLDLVANFSLLFVFNIWDLPSIPLSKFLRRRELPTWTIPSPSLFPWEFLSIFSRRSDI